MSVQSAASYAWGWCTAFVAEQLSWVPAGWGNAIDWLDHARSQGFRISQTPVAGSVAVYGTDYSPLGHVAQVLSVNADGTFKVAEEAFKGVGITDTRTSTMHGVLGFILPPVDAVAGAIGNAAGSAASGAGNLANIIPGVSQAEAVGNFLGWITQRETLIRGALIVVGIVVAVIGLRILFEPQIEAAGRAASSAAEIAAA